MTSNKTKLLILDFDGVICDSAVECMITSYNARIVINNISSVKVYQRTNLDEQFNNKFIKFRPLVRIAKEYYLLCERIIDGTDLDSLHRLIPRDQDERDRMDAFHDCFYRERASWMADDIAGWLASNPLYPGTTELFNNDNIKQDIMIVSAKDKTSINAVLSSNGIDTDGLKIFGSDTGLDKQDLTNRAQSEARVQLSEISFLDDNLENLIMISEMGVNVYMAEWGYSLDQQKDEAKTNNIPIIKLDDLDRWARTLV
jgi:phosphoglycolate phosphatase-like HAD superfamily hydrolase